MNREFYSKHFTLEKVSDGVYAALAKTGGGAVANAGFVDLGDKVIVFDTFNTQQASQDLKYAAEMITNQKVTLVVNSHWHGDHIRGNQTFKDSNIISSQTTLSKIKELHPLRIKKQKDDIQGLSNYIDSLKNQLDKSNNSELQNQINFLSEIKNSLPTLELVLPSQTFMNELNIQGTTRNAKLFTLGGGHSYCDAMLYIPENKVIFMGDLLFVNCHPTFFEESNPKKWIEILHQVKNLEIEAAIPGHGSIGTKEDITKIITYIKYLMSIIIENNKADKAEIPTIYRDWTSPEVYHQNIKRLEESLIK
ncbi:MBL fold metallo-hydrolase [Neobacillus drentensis]|uniref:MBL fold metallo-hydrolase n=1 Tax=Neobacillus drentensis TaxID=220684 RepID=UPI001F1ADF85|nr:MBL fold metallo-hydrolase [Neobacillus drentensis]ULT59335.1 MBL fold metallo-hydrolase [Neobacillus drentensis]